MSANFNSHLESVVTFNLTGLFLEQALSWSHVGWAGLGWAGLGWAGLGWAGLGWAL